MVHYIATNTSTPFNLGDFDTLYVPPGVALNSTTDEPIESVAITNRGQNVLVAGSVYSASDSAILLRGDQSVLNLHNVTVLEGASVASNDNVTTRAGIAFTGVQRSTITNEGSVMGPSGIYLFQTNDISIFNSGSVGSTLFGYGVRLNDAQDVRLVNSGTISGSIGVRVYDSSAQIVNSGEIFGTDDPAIAFLSAVPSGPLAGLDIQNSGLITGPSVAIEGYTGTAVSVGDRIDNTGQILGDVQLHGGDDTVFNAGLIDGVLSLGDGNDFYFGSGAALVTRLVDGGAGRDLLSGSSAPDLFHGRADVDLLLGYGGNDILWGADGNDTLRGNAGDDTMYGGSDDDLMHGGIGHDSLEGGDGRDTQEGHGGDDTLLGQAGSDTLLGNGGSDLLDGGAGFDILFGGIAGDTLEGGTGADTLWGQGGEDSLSGGDQSDLLYGGGLDDTLDGGAGFDLLDGGRGADVLDGGPGNDTLTGGRGDDDLTGGIGADVFVFGWANGNDVIHDFQNTLDRIDLSLLDVALPDVIAAVSAVGSMGSSAVLLDLNALGASGTVLIDGVPLAGIGGGDFIL